MPPGVPCDIKLSKGQRRWQNKQVKKAEKRLRWEEEAQLREPTAKEIAAVNEEWEENTKEPVAKRAKIDNPTTSNKENITSFGPQKNVERCLRNELGIPPKPDINPLSAKNRKQPPSYKKPELPNKPAILAESKLCLVSAFPGQASKDFVFQAKLEEKHQKPEEKIPDYEQLAAAPRISPEDRRYYRAMSKMQHVPGVVTVQFNHRTQQPLKPVP